MTDHDQLRSCLSQLEDATDKIDGHLHRFDYGAIEEDELREIIEDFNQVYETSVDLLKEVDDENSLYDNVKDSASIYTATIEHVEEEYGMEFDLENEVFTVI